MEALVRLESKTILGPAPMPMAPDHYERLHDANEVVRRERDYLNRRLWACGTVLFVEQDAEGGTLVTLQIEGEGKDRGANEVMVRYHGDTSTLQPRARATVWGTCAGLHVVAGPACGLTARPLIVADSLEW